MLFTEFRFLPFLVVVFGVHWWLRRSSLRKLWLLLASYVFYAGWDWRFLSLILISTCVDYSVGRRLARVESDRGRRLCLTASVVANLGLLGFFKYYNFFADSAAAFLTWLGFHPSSATLEIVLPVGISFYTFQTMSYTIDVYRRKLEPVRSFSDFALFVAFFPQLVAGPIVRASSFLPQLTERRVFLKHVAVRSCLVLFLIGYFKKACLADGVSVVVDKVFADPEAYSTLSTWISLALYHIQVYCDFSGYSDMAIATAGLLGYRLADNFDFPYFAGSIGEFWRRWHISLGSWLKDYLYFPLGGGRVSWPKRIRNVYVTIILCGLWHGAGWKFIAFGALHATYVAGDQIWKHMPLRKGHLGRVTAAVSLPATTFLLFLGWPIFRSESFENTVEMFRIFLFLGPGGPQAIDANLGWLFVGCAVVHWVLYKRYLHARLAAMPHVVFAAVYAAAWALTLPFVSVGAKPFIYFQF